MTYTNGIYFEARINNIRKWESISYVHSKGIKKKLGMSSYVVKGICENDKYHELNNLRFLTCYNVD